MRTAPEHALAHWQPTFHAANGTSLKRVKSRNWSGYADDHSKGATYGMITGKWTVPTGKRGDGAVARGLLRRMQYRPGLSHGFLASTGLDLTPFCNLHH